MAFLKDRWLSICSSIALLILWEMSCRLGWINPILLTPPLQILDTGYEELRTGKWNPDFLTTGKAFLYSILIALTGGVLVAVFMGISKTVFHLVNPYVVAINALPKIMLCPLVMLWLGTGISARVFLGTMMAAFPIITSTLTGVQSIDKNFLLLAKVYKSSRKKIFFDILLPSLAPYILSGLRVGVNYAMVGILIVEFFASSEGVGYRMYAYSQNFAIDQFFVLLILTVLFVLFCSSIVQLGEQYFGGWRDAAFK